MSLFQIFMMGFSVFMAMSTLFKSAINGWERANLYCSLLFTSTFLNCAFWVADVDLADYGFYSASQVDSNPGLWFNHLNPVFLLLLQRSFLNIKNESPRFYQLMTVSISVLFFVILTEIILTFFPKYSSIFTLATGLFQLILLLLFSILPFYALRFWRHPIYRYAAWSTWVIFLVFATYMFLSVTGWGDFFPVWFAGDLLFKILVVDGVLFLLALSLRDRQVLLDKIHLEQQSTLSELKALRAQMNPHFIFNCLNSIKSYTLNHDMEGANYYLTKFSKLIRQVLDNSRNEKIVLKNELETLSLYLEMEKMRVGDKFDYDIVIAEEVEQEFIEVPPMLIQPYVENAIWHGLMHKEGGGKVSIDVQQKDDNHLLINIKDNGIGREKANELKSRTGTTQKSFGMKINAERLDIIKQLYNLEAKITIEDLKNADQSSAGTQVSLEIPIYQ